MTTSDHLDTRVSQISAMTFDTAALETELGLMREMWNKFKLRLRENHFGKLPSVTQSLFLLELKSLLFNNNLENGLGLSRDELKNMDSFLVKFEDHCIPRILLKFEMFKSLTLQNERIGSNFSHQTDAEDEHIRLVDMGTISQKENDSVNCALPLKEGNDFVSEQKLMSAMELFEKCGNNEEMKASSDFVISKMSQSEQVAFHFTQEITQELSLTRKENTCNREMKNESIKQCVSGKKCQKPEALIETSNRFQPFVNDEIKSGEAGLIENGIGSNSCCSSKSESMSSQGGTVQEAVNHRSSRGSKQIFCQVCGFESQNTRLLKEHLKSHAGKDKQKCTSCNAAIKQRTNLEPHLLVCLCAQKNPKGKQGVGKSCISEDSVTNQQTESQYLNNNQQSGHSTSECIVPLNCRSSSKSRSLKSYRKHHVKNKTKQLKCEICHSIFHGLAKLKRHKLIHTGEKPYKCNLCGTAFADKSHLNVHARLHSGEKPFKCDICEASFSESTKLKNHKRVHTGEKPYVCEICGSSFSVSSSLRSHMKIHSGERRFKCNVCDFASVHSSNLKAHLMVHTGEKKFMCDKCGASFTETAKLKRHKMVHTGERPYNCEVCGARFADKSHLTVHLRIHSGEKPFKCTFCDSAFVESSKLKNHIRTHTGEKPYVCEICGMSFAMSYSLKSHMRRHTGEKPYVCDICGYATSQSSNLKTHMVVHTGARSHVCAMCGASFSELSKLNRHKLIHLDQKEGSIEDPEQNSDELNSLPPELFYNFTGSDGIITL